MMSTNPHTKIINKISKETLGSLGVKRKGQSRIWLDDNGWWVTVIEFQPSTWSKGTYLNIAINFQQYPNEHCSFDIFNREAGFVEYISDEEFEPKILELAELAKSRVLEIREKLSSPEKLKVFALDYFREISSLRSHFHQGMACIVTGDKHNGILYLKKMLENSEAAGWANEQKIFARNLVDLIQSGGNYHLFINNVIDESRNLKKMEKTEIKLFANS